MLDYNMLFAVQSPGPDLDIVEILAQSDGHLRDTPVQTPGLLDSFKKWVWLIAEQLDPQNLTSCSPVACKYRELGRCEGPFPADMVVALPAAINTIDRLTDTPHSSEATTNIL